MAYAHTFRQRKFMSLRTQLPTGWCESFTPGRLFLRCRRNTEKRVCPGAGKLFRVLCSLPLDGCRRCCFRRAGNPVCLAEEHAHEGVFH